MKQIFGDHEVSFGFSLGASHILAHFSVGGTFCFPAEFLDSSPTFFFCLRVLSRGPLFFL